MSRRWWTRALRTPSFQRRRQRHWASSAWSRCPFNQPMTGQWEYEVGEARVRLGDRERTVLVVVGESGVGPLLGATTLELFNVAVDPVGRRLIRVPGLMKGELDGRPWRMSVTVSVD